MARIYHLNTTLGYNAPGRLVSRLMALARGEGHAVRAAYAFGEDARADGCRVGSTADRYAHALLTRITDLHGHGSTTATRRVIADMERFGPTVVHLHNLHGYWLDVPLMLRHLAEMRLPVVWTFHDFWPLTGHCAFPQTAGCGRWLDDGGCSHCPALRRYPASWGADRSARNFAERRRLIGALQLLRPVAVSQWQAGLISRALPRAPQCEAIHNPVDTGIFTISDSPRDPHLVLGAASVWDYRKGLDRFIELRRVLGPEYTIRLAGLTRRQARRLPPGIEAVARISDPAALARFFGSGRVFVNLSRAETLGMVNLEARACGTPVVSLSAGGMAETVPAGTGILLDSFDPLAVARAISAAPPPGAAIRPAPDSARAYLPLYLP